MNKIYALIDIDGNIINTILLDIETSNWVCPAGLALYETDVGIGNNLFEVLEAPAEETP